MSGTHARSLGVIGILGVTLLSGRVLDRTTGQPLSNVQIHAARASTSTDKDGRFRLTGLTPGTYTLTLQSDDVPLERVRVTIKAGRNVRDVRACSTTLDYGCGTAPPGGAG